MNVGGILELARLSVHVSGCLGCVQNAGNFVSKTPTVLLILYLNLVDIPTAINNASPKVHNVVFVFLTKGII